MGPDERPGQGMPSGAVKDEREPAPERLATVLEVQKVREELRENYETINRLLTARTKQLEDCEKTLRKCLIAFTALQAHTHSPDGKPVLSVGILNEAVFNT